MLGGDSPWLLKVLGISAYFRIGTIYTYAVWCDLKGKWVDRKWRRSPKSDKKLYKVYKKGLECTNAKGCVSEPLLHIEERFKFVVMCILHLGVGLGLVTNSPNSLARSVRTFHRPPGIVFKIASTVPRPKFCCSGCAGPARHALVVRHPPHSGACFGGAWPSSWWGVSRGGEKF